MSAISPSSIALDIALSSPQYAQQQRDDWGRSAFANLFDMHFQRDEAVPKDSDKTSPECADPVSDPGQSAGRQSPTHSLASSAGLFETASASGETAMTSAEGESSTFEANVLENGVAATPTGSDLDVEFAHDSSRSEPVLAAPQAAESESESAASVVMVALSADDRVEVSIRSEGLKSRHGLELLSRVRTELSWKGFALERMSINGLVVFSPLSGVAS